MKRVQRQTDSITHLNGFSVAGLASSGDDVMQVLSVCVYANTVHTIFVIINYVCAGVSE